MQLFGEWEDTIRKLTGGDMRGRLSVLELSGQSIRVHRAVRVGDLQMALGVREDVVLPLRLQASVIGESLS